MRTKHLSVDWLTLKDGDEAVQVKDKDRVMYLK